MKKYFLQIIVVTIILNACSSSNITNEERLKKYFDENKVEGTFALYNNAQGNFNIYNLSRYKDSLYMPASTFKIVNSLIGLQTGKITNTKMLIKWDGVKRGVEDWNKDITMEEAFKVSCVPYYQEVARRIGKDTMQRWLDSLNYGTKKITTKVDTFWLDNSLKIKPDEELGLVKKLYFEQLPFNKTTMQAVKNIMTQESNANYTLAYKTGWGEKENGKSIVWVVGWIEENKHPSFFVLNFEGEGSLDMAAIRKKILNNCLKELGYTTAKK
jgi:beta-lactamase class D